MSPIIPPLDGAKRFEKNTVEIPVLAVAFLESEQRDGMHVWYAVDFHGGIWTTDSPLETPWRRHSASYSSIPSRILGQLLMPVVRRVREYEEGIGSLSYNGIMPRDPDDTIRVFKCSLDRKV